MKILIADTSAIFYRIGFSTSTYMVENLKLQKQDNGLYDFNEYKDVFIFKFLDYISKFKNRFGVDEVILAIDSGPYWRKDHWSGYKYGRHGETSIDWKAIKDTQKEILELLDNSSTFKILKIPTVEADDVAFVLSKTLTDDGHEVIVYSTDHDWQYCLLNDNVKYWKTAYTAKNKQCAFFKPTLEEIETELYNHCMFGDKGDYLLHSKSYSVFSEEFKSLYPNVTELKAWPKRHEIDMSFREKHAKDFPELAETNKLSAYKHPRFGAKSYQKKKLKDGFTDEDFLNENPIYRMNFEMNKMLGLPDGIPIHLREAIIEKYKTTNGELNITDLSDYFMRYGLVNLVGKFSLF